MTNFKSIKFTDGDLSLDVRVCVEDNTIWLSASEMATLFNVAVTTIRRAIKSTYNVDTITKTTKGANNAYFASMVVHQPKKKPLIVYGLDVIKTLGLRFNKDIIEKLESFIRGSFSIKDNNDIIIYNNGSINLSVNVDPSEDTVWLTQGQIASLFETTRPNVTMHINNIFSEGELKPVSVSKDFLHTAPDGKQYLVQQYNLDMILAIGYRVKGKRAIEFRKWVTGVLNNYLLKGYAVDKTRLVVCQSNFEYLEKEVQNIKVELEKLQKEFIDSPIKEKLFFAGQFFDAYAFLCSLMKRAKENVLVVDPFFDLDALSILSKASKNVKKSVFFSKRTELAEKDVKKFNSQYGHLHLYLLNSYHDRFIIIDNKECYSVGTSLNHAGRLTFIINLIESPGIINSLITNIHNKKKQYRFDN